MNEKKFSGFVLAGGKSSRMRSDKAFLKLEGETFVARAARTLSEAGTNPVKIVLNSSQNDLVERFPQGVAAIFDVFENRGALGGIHAALKNCDTKYAVILAVDLPFVTAPVVEKLCRFAADFNKSSAVVPRQSDGRFQPLCAVYHAKYCLPPLEKLLNETVSAPVRDFLKRIAPRFVDEKKLSEETNDVFFNVNHPADFEQLL